jgi:hypothetical protein
MRAVAPDPRALDINSSRAGQVAGGASASVLLGLGVLHAAWGTGDSFRRLDRRFYSPLCLTLAALTWLSLAGATT